MYLIRRIVLALGRRIKWCFITMGMYLMRVFPIKENKIVFLNYYGKGYGDNAKYICDLLKKQSDKYELVWALHNMQNSLPVEVRPVKYGSLKFYYDLCTAKIWINNCRMPLYIRKRKQQFYIQTWHGDMCIKKTEGDAQGALYPSYIKGAKNDSRMANLFVTGNEWMVEIYRRAYWYEGEVFRSGYPRRDILYRISSEEKGRIKKSLGINQEEKVVLYAPTFREKTDLRVFMINWDLLLSALKDRFGGNWRGMIRLHPNISRMANQLNLPKDIINVTDYDDMQELLAMCDICITDYSSSVLEFAVTGKPGFIFAVDYDDYKKERDVYFEFSELPFPFAMDNEQLANNILAFDSEQYKARHQAFYKDRLKVFEDGTASEKLAERIRKECHCN